MKKKEDTIGDEGEGMVTAWAGFSFLGSVTVMQREMVLNLKSVELLWRSFPPEV